MKFGKLFKILTILGCAGVLAATFAGCGEKEPETPKKTHDPVTLEVTGKPGTYEAHNFVDGKCTMCDETTIFSQDSVAKDAIVTSACDRQGAVEEIKYTTDAYPEYEYADENGLVTKTAWVYLPYGYDAEDTSTKYNVLILMHGKGLNEGYWFAKGSYADPSQQGAYMSGGNGTANLLDTMMKDGTAEKTIVVTPTAYLPGEDGNTANGNSEEADANMAMGRAGFTDELLYDLMPYIAENYNIYAETDGDMTDDEIRAELVANRAHQGYAGLSMGSVMSYQNIWAQCLDCFAYIGSYSGGVTEAEIDALVEGAKSFGSYKVGYWYACLGTSENSTTYYGDPLGTYRALLKSFPNLQSGSDLAAGDNCQYMLCNNTAHNYTTWITGLYNCMQVFFKADIA